MDMNKPDEKALWNKFVDGGMDDWEGNNSRKITFSRLIN